MSYLRLKGAVAQGMPKIFLVSVFFVLTCAKNKKPKRISFPAAIIPGNVYVVEKCLSEMDT